MKQPAAADPLDPGEGPGVYRGLIVKAINAQPEVLPDVGVWLAGPHASRLAIIFPNIPGLRIDGWLYESGGARLPLDSAGTRGENTIELRHRYQLHPEVVHVTTVTAGPGAVELTGHLEVEIENAEGGEEGAEKGARSAA